MEIHGNLRRIKTIMKAEFTHIFRDPVSLIISLIMPLQMVFLFGYATRYELRELPIGVYDMDLTQESRDYVKTIDNTSYFHVKYTIWEYDRAINLMDCSKTKCVIIIPSGFSREIKEYKPAHIQTIVDGSEVTSAQFIINYLSAINASLSKDITMSLFQKKGMTVDLEPIRLSHRAWYNQSLSDTVFVVSGVFSLSIMGFVPILSALAIVREKESGSIQQIFSSPIHPYEYIAGKMIPYVILLTLDMIVVIMIGLWWFEIPMRGSFSILVVSTFLMVFATVAIGFFISTLTKSQLTALLFGVVFTLMPAFIFGDTIVPIQNSPQALRIYACVFPARFYTGICRAQIIKDSAFISYWEDAVALVIYCIVIFSICVWQVRTKRI